jgi:DNA repair exonuclease SbcCD ATPase subunit
MKRNFKYDAQLSKYVLNIESDVPLMDGKKVVGHQYQTFKQEWDPEQLSVLINQMNEQETTYKKQLAEQEKQLKEVQMTDREKQTIKVFAENLKKAQNLQKIEQIETAIKNLKDAIVKIKQDKKELEDAIQKG